MLLPPCMEVQIQIKWCICWTAKGVDGVVFRLSPQLQAHTSSLQLRCGACFATKVKRSICQQGTEVDSKLRRGERKQTPSWFPTSPSKSSQTCSPLWLSVPLCRFCLHSPDASLLPSFRGTSPGWPAPVPQPSGDRQWPLKPCITEPTIQHPLVTSLTPSSAGPSSSSGL